MKANEENRSQPTDRQGQERQLAGQPAHRVAARIVRESGLGLVGKHRQKAEDEIENAIKVPERERQRLAAQVDATWAMIHNCWDIEPREYFEAEAPHNGFVWPLAMAVHYMWKRKVKPSPTTQDTESALRGNSPELSQDSPASKLGIAVEDCICHKGSVCTMPACDLYHHEGCSVHKNYHANVPSGSISPGTEEVEVARECSRRIINEVDLGGPMLDFEDDGNTSPDEDEMIGS